MIAFFCRDDRIRTCDHMTPSHVRYRAAENLYWCYFDVAVAYFERLWTTRKNFVDYGVDIFIQGYSCQIFAKQMPHWLKINLFKYCFPSAVCFWYCILSTYATQRETTFTGGTSINSALLLNFLFMQTFKGHDREK